MRFNYVIYVTTFRGDVWIRKPVTIILEQPVDQPWVCVIRNLLSVDNFDGTFRTHDRYLCSRPSEVEVCSNVFASENVIRTSIGFAYYDREFRNCGFTVGEE